MYSPILVGELEDSFTALPQTEEESVSSYIHKPVKPAVLVNTTEIIGESSSSESSPIDVVIKSSSETNPGPWLQLSHIASSINEPMSGAKKLRKMLEQTDELIICPGVYDGLSARTAIELGFNAMYMVSICQFWYS